LKSTVCILKATLTAALVVAHGHAGATLGEPLPSVQADAQRLGGQHKQAAALQGAVHTLTLADGSVIRQYTNHAGIVYAVSWNARSKPRLDQLLGAHFASYSAAARQAAQQRPGVQHSAQLRSGDLVVNANAHLNAHVGQAYLKSLLPSSDTAYAIR
jgi:hypothetical protein